MVAVANPTSFSQRLRELRDEADLSQYELAIRSGLTKQALSKLEMGGVVPNWDTVRRLARALGVDVSAFDDKSESLIEPPEPRSPPGRPRKDQPATPQPAEPEPPPPARPSKRR